MVKIKGFSGVEIRYDGHGVMSIRSLKPLDVERVDVYTDAKDLTDYEYEHRLPENMEES